MKGYPKVNYIGNKERIADAIMSAVPAYAGTLFDAFAGGCSVSYAAKARGMRVYSNDILDINYQLAKALIENSGEVLTDRDVEDIFAGEPFCGFMTGNYAATTVPLDAYFISDNAFYLADYEGVSLKGFRAYITLGGLAQANRLLIDVGGGTTGVDGLQAVEADPLVDVYTMEGRRVKCGVRKSVALDGLPRGVYVVGGEKVAR